MNWLDKYSDDVSKAQKGKKVKPIYVDSKNDPRYIAYQDSLTAYNYGEKEYAKFLKDRNEHNRYIKEKTTIQRPSVDKEDVERLKQTPFPIYENSLAQDRRWNVGRESVEEAQQNKGKLLRITNNKPISVNSIKYTDIKQNDPGVLDILGRIVGVETERSEDYNSYVGNSSYSRYKKPQQPVIVKSTTTKPSTKSKPSTKPQQKEVNVKPQLQPKVEALNIQPIQTAPISFPIQEIDTRMSAKIPKAFNVSTQRYNMEGEDDYYVYNQENVDYTTALRAKQASDAYNRYIAEKYGNEEALKNPKAVERLKQLKQNVNITPVYKNGGEFLGTTDEGFDYNGAWGGQFQIGGEVPKRRGVRQNPDGTVSTHLMATETDGKGNWFSFPTLFQNSIPYADDSENWVDMSDRPWEEAYEEAKKRGEVINFGSDKDAAIKFGQGSWKEKMQMGGNIYPVNYVPQAQDGKKTPKLDTTKLDFSIPKSTGYAWADEKLKKQKKALEEFKKWKTKVDTEVKKIQKKLDVPESTAREVYKRQQGLSVPTVEEVREYTPQSTLSKTWDVITNPMTAAGYIARNEDVPDYFTKGERNNLDMATDVVNPAAWVNYAGHGIKDLSNVPGQLMEGDFEGAGESTLSGSLNLLSVIPIAQELKPFVPSTVKTLPKAKNFREALGTFKGIPTEQSLPRLSPQELKTYRQVQEIGRLRATGKPISEQYRYALEQNIPDEHFEKVFGRTKSEVEQILPSVIEQETFRSSIPIRERFNLERAPRRRSSSDAAIDQTQTRDGVIRYTLSDFVVDDGIDDILQGMSNNQLRPIPEELFINTNNRGRTIINSQSPRLSLKETAIDDWERYVDNKVPTSEVINDKFSNIVSKYPYYKGPVLENVPSLSLSTSGSLKNVSKKVGDQSVSGISSGDIFTGSLNTSHSSYLPQIKQIFKYNEGAPQFLGYRPMNHLGFLSDFRYSQDDIAKYLNTEIDQQISRGVLPKDILRPYVTDKDKVILPHYGIKQFEEGGVIKDDLGQWAHPGEITEINSNDITMQGVPYPVLGISDTGDVQMMYPEEEYKFDGNKVTEYPLAKDGKELVKLNQLTNFTNYNTKQPGGWLDKY